MLDLDALTLPADTSDKATADFAEWPLWPATAPGSAGVELTERCEDSGTAEDPRRILQGIGQPCLQIYRPQQPNGAAALVMVGGGYTSLVIDSEGTDVARWLNSLGITAAVLKHRLPGEGHADGAHVPLQDAQRGMRLLRAHAAELRIDAQRCGVVGLSSGAHLASALGTAFDKAVYAAQDASDQIEARPAFMVLGYGPYSANARQCLLKPDQAPLPPAEKQALYDAYPTDLLISAATPPCFLMHTDDDPRVNPLNSIRFYQALKTAGVAAELHIFQEGGHGVAIRRSAGFAVASWTTLCAHWLMRRGILPQAG